MKYRFEFRPYQRKFKQPLATSHGLWEVREGIILRLTDESDRVGWGEIAPLEWFDSESCDRALAFCDRLPSIVTTDDIFSIPAELPACQFGFEAAWEGVGEAGGAGERGRGGEGKQGIKKIAIGGLLPSGEAALDEWRSLWQQGYRTFKWKIGIASLSEELAIFDALTNVLPRSAKLRLDANGGLNLQQAKAWLNACDRVGIEFLEQPLPTTQFNEMLDLSQQYHTAIALDESVSNLARLQMCYQQGWRGIFVIKPAIAGSPKALREFCLANRIDAVFSSVLETPIGQKFGLKLASELTRRDRAAGYGVEHWFTPEDSKAIFRIFDFKKP